MAKGLSGTGRRSLTSFPERFTPHHPVRTYGLSDVTTHLRECTAVCSDQHVVSLAANGFTHGRAACGRLACGPPNRPERVDRHRLTERGIEALHINEYLNVSTCGAAVLVGRDGCGTEEIREVLCDDTWYLAFQ